MRWLKQDTLHSLQGFCYESILVDNMVIQLHGIRYTAAQGGDCKPHQHEFFELHYIVSGNVSTTIGGVTRKIGDGQFYLMTPRSIHEHFYPPPGNIGFALRWSFEPFEKECKNPELISMANTLSKAPPYPIYDQNDEIAGQIRSMMSLSSLNASHTRLKFMFVNLLFSLAQIYHDVNARDVEGSEPRTEASAIHAAIAYIHSHCIYPITVYDVADHVHMSYSHLARLFMRYGHDSIGNYIVRARIDKAQHLLLTSDLSISQITRQVGFGTISHFSNTFRKMAGVSPRQYRLSYQEYQQGIPTQL